MRQNLKTRLTLPTDKRYLIVAAFFYSTSVTAFASHSVTPFSLQHDKITRRLITTQLDAVRHAISACHLQQHACIPAVAEFYAVEKHSSSAETFCDRRRGVGGSCGDLLVWKKHVTRCNSWWWRLWGWLLGCRACCWSRLQLSQFCVNHSSREALVQS